MLSNQQRSRNVTTDTAVQSVFVMLQHLHPDLHRFMQLLENKRGEMSTTIILDPHSSFFLAYFENLQDKLTQLKDAREALNALRAEHHERKQREALERDRQRQMQLAQKLDLMRQKKQVRANTRMQRSSMECWRLGISGISAAVTFTTLGSARSRNEDTSWTTATTDLGTRTILPKSSNGKEMFERAPSRFLGVERKIRPNVLSITVTFAYRCKEKKSTDDDSSIALKQFFVEFL